MILILKFKGFTKEIYTGVCPEYFVRLSTGFIEGTPTATAPPLQTVPAEPPITNTIPRSTVLIR